MEKTYVELIQEKGMKKKFQAFLKREEKKLTSEQKEEIKKLERKALNLWKAGVKVRAEGKCEISGCKKTGYLNAHHIESFITNRLLRYDLENGVLLCSTHHKFGWLSAHKSFCFMWDLLISKREKSLAYLLSHYSERELMTKERLEKIIEGLSVFEKKEKKKRRKE